MIFQDKNRTKILGLFIVISLIVSLVESFKRLISSLKLLLSIINPEPNIFPEASKNSENFLVWLVSNPPASAFISTFGIAIHLLFTLMIIFNVSKLYLKSDHQNYLTVHTVNSLKNIIACMITIYLSQLFFFKDWNIDFGVFTASLFILYQIIKAGFKELQEEKDSIV